MATRARIAMHEPGKGYLSIYTHWDGDPSHHLKILVNHYREPMLVSALMAAGDMSTLRRTVEECETYKSLGEECPAVYSETLDDLFARALQCGAEYVYVFEGGRWGWAHAEADASDISDELPNED